MKLILPLPPRSLHPNGRANWRTYSKDAKAYRILASEECFAQCYEQKHKGHVINPIIGIKWFYARDSWIPDRDNVVAALKHAFDGMAHAGLFKNDRECFYLPVELEKDAKQPRVELTIYRSDPDLIERIKSELVEV